MIDRILVPLDGSPLAECTLCHAAALASAFDAEVCLLRILPPARAGGLSHDAVENRLERREAETYLVERAEGFRTAGTAVRVSIGEGRPAEEIVRWADAHDVDLILASAWGRGGPTVFRLGGTARKLVAGGTKSIMLVRPPAEATNQKEPARYEGIMVPVDGSRRGDWALCLATSIARAQGAELLVVHVVSVSEHPERLPRAPDEERLQRELVRIGRASAERYLEEVSGRFAATDVRLRTKVVVAPRVPDALLQTARTEGAGLVVMSAHGASGDMPWPYGSVASSLLSYCDLPLLVFQDLPAARPSTRPDRVKMLSVPTANATAG